MYLYTVQKSDEVELSKISLKKFNFIYLPSEFPSARSYYRVSDLPQEWGDCSSKLKERLVVVMITGKTLPL